MNTKNIYNETFLEPILNGFGQIMLQKSQLTGIFFTLGILHGNWRAGIASLLAAIVGFLTAKFLRFNTQNVKDGLYSFSPILFAIAIVNNFSDSVLLWFMVILGSALIALLQHLFISKNIPAFTFPFIVGTWLFLAIGKSLNLHPFVGLSLTVSASSPELSSGIRAFGEVIFQENFLSGLLFFIGVLISSPSAGFYGLIAAYLGTGIALLCNMSLDEVNLGLFGFNAVLTAIAFSNEKRNKLFWIVFGSLVTVAINIVIQKNGLLNSFGGAFTLPFVLGTWIALLLKNKISKYY